MHRRLQKYLAELSRGRLILWFYLIWYFVVLVRYFDPSPGLWVTSVGISAIIGTALVINANSSTVKHRLDFWPTFRFYLTPLCASSFAALVKGKGFYLVFSPHPLDLLIALTVCGALWLATIIARRLAASSAPNPTP